MNGDATKQPPQPQFHCPHCNHPLRLAGGIVELGKLKKWVDEWRCPTHGAVDPRAVPPRTDPKD